MFGFSSTDEIWSRQRASIYMYIEQRNALNVSSYWAYAGTWSQQLGHIRALVYTADRRNRRRIGAEKLSPPPELSVAAFRRARTYLYSVL
jgi:hypothetical protein